MNVDLLETPLAWLEPPGTAECEPWLREYDAWLGGEGQAISDAVDRAGTPWLRMFDLRGRRVDEILYPPEYGRLLQRGYQAGVVWRAFAEPALSLRPSFRLLFITAFHDAGLACPYTVSLATAALLSKYGASELQERFLPPLLERERPAWQGATWMTEIKGGSDLGAAVDTLARPEGARWRLSGDKYFASNAGADLALVAARREGAPRTVRGLNLYLVPRRGSGGEHNYCIRRLKDKIGTRSVPTGEIELRDSEAWPLGRAEDGFYHLLEVLNLSRTANSIASVALAQRALADAYAYARQRTAFGAPIFAHPLLRRQFDTRLRQLRAASRLAWFAVRLLDELWRQTPPYPERYYMFRLVTHLAKYWTAALAVATAQWAIEVHGGAGVLQEFRVERWLREAMILAIWEGTSHRHMLEALDLIERHGAHRLLFQHLAAPAAEQRGMEARLEHHLSLPAPEKQAALAPLIRDLARFTADSLAAPVRK
ncbi:MAG: acyl-CoA dehydrogenase family protein [Terriglobales bacterium]